MPEPFYASGAESWDAVGVLSEAFHEYPVMRFILGEPDETYGERLDVLNRFFVGARVHREEPTILMRHDRKIVGAALVVFTGRTVESPELDALREETWEKLGPDARDRYDHYGAITKQFTRDDPHHHLSMIGVRRTYLGQGLGRKLLDAVHDASRNDSASSGVSLETEVPANVKLYEHVGYEIVGSDQVTAGFRTWSMFRPDEE